MKDYFASAASYYKQFRPFYPEPLLAQIQSSFSLTKQDSVIS